MSYHPIANQIYNLLIQDKITTVEFLENFQSVQIPFEVLVEACGTIKPRYYTISSSSLASPSKIDLTISLLAEKTSRGIFKGLCSQYLSELDLHRESIRCTLRRSCFELPKDFSSPVIMIAAGSGIAPMRAFIQEGTFYKSRGNELKDWTLFFGCRYEKVDFIYQVN
jgi:sulfite reductase alpha subunit-like flavoprotein